MSEREIRMESITPPSESNASGNRCASSRTPIADVGGFCGHPVTVKGHVHSIRNLGKVSFVTVRDQSGLLQIVVEQPQLMQQARILTPETAVKIEGNVRAITPSPSTRQRSKTSPGTAQGPHRAAPSEIRSEAFELHATAITLLSEAAEVLPVEIAKSERIKKLSLSTLLDYRPITLRAAAEKAIFKVEAILARAFREFLNSEGFTEIHSPKLVATGTEGGANLFAVNYFGRNAFLAQSPQFYKQIMVGVFERVFEIAAVYRAEEHDTSRHLNEYVSMDLEVGFIESEQDLMELETRLLNHMLLSVREEAAIELAFFHADIAPIETIPQITYLDAVHLLQSNYGWQASAQSAGEMPPDLDPEAERLLHEHFRQETGSELLYITSYPHAVRPFYAMPLEASPEYSAVTLSRSFDLIYRGLEITTGGQRIHNASALSDSIRSRSMNPEQFQDYMQCFRYGMPPHGGLAIGLERLAKQILQLPNVKMAALFPRDRNRLTP